MTNHSAPSLPLGDLIPLSVAARIAGRARQTLHQMRLAGKLDAVRVGRHWFTTRAEAERVGRIPKGKGGRPVGWRKNHSDSNKITVDTEQ